MAIVNRTLDASQQTLVVKFSKDGVIGTGVTVPVGLVPSNSTLKAVKLAAAGLSGSPVVDLSIWRFIVGAGVTVITGGATSLTVVAEGTSGVQSFVLAASGSSLLNLLSGDKLIAVTSGANTAGTNYAIEAVIQMVQDIRTVHGV